MIQTKDLSFLARAARTLTGATTMARAAMLLAVMMMLGVQTARAQTYARSIITGMYEHGTVTTDKTSAYEGETVTLTVTPDAGYHLALLYLGDGQSISYSGSTAIFPVQSSTDPSKYTFTCPATIESSAALHVTATFEEGASLTIRVVPEGGGTYSVSADHTKLYVTPNTGYYLVSVMRTGTTEPLQAIGTGDEEPYYSVSASDDITINFRPYTNNVRVRFNMQGHGDAIANQNLTLGEKVTRPTPDPTAENYEFLSWFTNSSCTTPYDFDTVLDNTLSYSVPNDCYTLTLYAGWIAEADHSGSCGSEVTWAVTKSAGSSDYDVLTISGSGEMTDYSNKNKRPWKDLCAVIKTIVIGEGVTHISQYAFHDFVNVTSDITIPASVTSIGQYAFQRVSWNTAAGIHISASEGSALTSIGKYAFELANGGIDLSRCASLTAISTDHVFRAVTKDVTLPSSMTSICKWAFNRFEDYAFTGDHAYVVVPEGKALSVTITLNEGTESRVLVPTDGKSDILACLYADPSNREESRALTLAMVDMLGDNNYTMTGWDGSMRDVALCRTFPAGKKQTVCLPFAPTAIYDLGTVWEFTGIESGKVVMTERTLSTDGALKANTPYIFEANASNPDVTGILFPNVAISIGSDPKTAPVGEDFVFQGTYSRIDWAADALPAGLYGFVAKDDNYSQGEFVKAYKDTFIRPFRAYLLYTGSGDLSGTETAARRKSAAALPDVIDIVWKSASGATTGITTTNFTNYTNAADAWYSLDGRRLSGKPTKRGMYLNNGKKIIIK